jgi:hypothetical protein
MGNKPSVIQITDRQKLLEATKTTRGLMDEILEYFLKQVNIRDFSLLSSPTECKKYVIVMANALQSFFYQIGIEPVQGKDGIIAFREIKDLAVPSSDVERKRKQSLCLMLAYFYTRVFQIYGALALTLIDDASIGREKGVLFSGDEKKDIALAPGVVPFIKQGFIGGAILTANLGSFAFMKEYLYDSAGSYGYPLKTSKHAAALQIITRDMGIGGIRALPITSAKLYIEIKIGYRKKYIELDLTSKAVDGISGNKIRVEVGRGRFESKVFDIPERVLSHRSFTVEKISDDTYRVVGTSVMTPIDKFNTIIDAIIPYVRDRFEEDGGRGHDNEYEKDRHGRRKGDREWWDDREDKRYSNARYAEKSKEADEHLRIDKLIKNLTTIKPLGHCVARALQLLRVSPYDSSAESNICKAKFLDTKTVTDKYNRRDRYDHYGTYDDKYGSVTYSRAGLPMPGETLDNSPGLVALSNLFYDTIEKGSPQLVMSNGALKEYMQFMKTMSTYFGDSKGEDADAYKALQLKGVSNKRDRDICGAKIDSIPVNDKKAKDIQEVIRDLYRIQLQHAAKAGKIINRLFLIETNSRGELKIHFHPNVLKKGLPEINAINQDSRKVLVEYYQNCELAYMSGVNIVMK